MAVVWHEFDQRPELDQALARELSRQLATSLNRTQRATLAVSGGSTPKGLFAELANQELTRQSQASQALDWSRVDITLVDERFVAPDHADSNARLVTENLLRHNAASANFIPMCSAEQVARDPDKAVTEFISALAPLLPLTVAVMGMGGDGHTASWFPDSPQLAAMIDPTGQDLAAEVTTPSSPHARLTLTLPTVVQSERVFLHITGAEKRDVLECNLTGELQQPIAALVNHPGVTVDVYWAP